MMPAIAGGVLSLSHHPIGPSATSPREALESHGAAEAERARTRILLRVAGLLLLAAAGLALGRDGLTVPLLLGEPDCIERGLIRDALWTPIVSGTAAVSFIGATVTAAAAFFVTIRRR